MKKEDKEIEEIKRTLKARIIPNLPLEPEYLRKNIQDIIDKFEFKWYFDQERQKTIEMIEKRIKELNKQNLKLGWDGKDWIKDPEILSPNKRDNAYRTTDENIIKIQELQDLKRKVEK